MHSCVVSVIIPVYKVEDYLDKCVESVVNQSVNGLEIILVDDGSPDRCPEICDFWAKKDSRVIVIHQDNMGLSAARNAGIRVARGEWLYFLDSDDWINVDCLELMMKCVLNYPKAQIICAGALPTGPGFEWMDITSKSLPDYCDDRNWINRAFLLRTKLMVTAWNKLIRKDFVLNNNLFFEEGVYSEDDVWNFMLSKHVERVAVCKRNTYNYLVAREGSIINDISSKENRIVKLLEIFTNNITDPFRKRQISFIYNFINVHLPSGVTKNYSKRFFIVRKKMIKEAKGCQKVALYLYYNAPKLFVYNYHILGRLMSAIGEV